MSFFFLAHPVYFGIKESISNANFLHCNVLYYLLYYVVLSILVFFYTMHDMKQIKNIYIYVI